MRHPNRSRRKANVARRKAAESKQAPKTAEDVAKRTAWRRAIQLRRYPVPPVYRLSYEHPEPTQPACYEFQRV